MPAAQLQHIRTEALPELWACNAPALVAFMAMPWIPGQGLDWSQLDRALKASRRGWRGCGRPQRRALPEQLRQCEVWVLSELAERQRQQGQAT